MFTCRVVNKNDVYVPLVWCSVRGKRMRAPEVSSAEQARENRTVIWHGVRYVLRSQILQGLARLSRWERYLYFVLRCPTIISVLFENKVRLARYCFYTRFK